MTTSIQHIELAKKEVLLSVIKALAEGARPWESGYMITRGRPQKANGGNFNGFNSLILGLCGERQGYTSPYWLTFKQGKENGGFLRKGSKGVKVFRPRIVEDKDDLDEAGNPKEKFAGWVAYTVFNADLFRGLPKMFHPEPVKFGTKLSHKKAKAFFDALPVQRLEQNKTPYFARTGDYVSMPPVSSYKTESDYWCDLAHECIHWTGHKDRLDRKSGAKGTQEYAFEELVAEMGAAFLLPTFGIKPKVNDQHAPYLAGYLSLFEDKPEALFKAASMAARASDYLVNLVAVKEYEAA